MRTHPGRTLASALYAVVLLLAALPLVDVVLTAWPFNPSQLPWRVGFLGLLSRALPLPLLAAALALITAFLLEQFRLLKWLSVVSIGMSVILLASTGLLVLDAVQMRGAVRPEVKLIYDVTAARGIVTLLVMSGIFLWLGAGGWIAARKPKHQHRAPAAGGTLLTTPAVVGGASTTAPSSSGGTGSRAGTNSL